MYSIDLILHLKPNTSINMNDRQYNMIMTFLEYKKKIKLADLSELYD